MRMGVPGGPHRTGRKAPPRASSGCVNKNCVKPALPLCGLGSPNKCFFAFVPTDALLASSTPERYRSAHFPTTAPVVLCFWFPVSIAKLEAHGKRFQKGTERPLRGLSALRGYGSSVTKSPLSKSAPPAPKYRFLSSYGSGMGGCTTTHPPEAVGHWSKLSVCVY